MSNSNRIMLFVFVAVIIGILYYFVPYKYLNNREQQLRSEVSTLTAEYNQLSQDLMRKDQFLEDIDTGKTELERLATILPQNLPQENMIALVHDIEETLDLKVEQFAMSDEIIFDTYDEPNNTDNTEYAIYAEMGTEVIVNYDQLKDLLNYINNNPHRMVLRDLSLTSSPESGEIKVLIRLTTYGIKIPGREENEVYLGEFEYGKSSVFLPYDDYSAVYKVDSSFASTDEDSPDFFIILDPIQSDRATTTMGKSLDPTGESYVVNDSEFVVEGEMYFYQSGADYYYKYKIGESTYPIGYGSGVFFSPGEELEIQIMSSDRYDLNDVSGLHLNIINDTDMAVNIVYFSEDFNNPRFTFESEGEVVIH